MICYHHRPLLSHAPREQKKAPRIHVTGSGRAIFPHFPSLSPETPKKVHMPASSINRKTSRSSTDSADRNIPIPTNTSRPNTRNDARKNGTTAIVEELQDIKDSLEGRKYLERYTLLCPEGEPPTHATLSTCLHQISAMPGVQKPVINAIRAVAFLLDEMEDSHINETLREALDSQMTEFTSDMKLLIEDAKEKIGEHIKANEERSANTTTTTPPSQSGRLTSTYASILVNPPAYANPKITAKEGIKARQFMLEGIKSSKFSHLDISQLKTELNKIITDIGPPEGKIRTLTKARTGGIIIEMNTDNTATWLSDNSNQRKLCDKIGSNTEFRTRAYNTMAFNVPLIINPDDESHRLEICEANDIEVGSITALKWAKAIEKRNPNQRTAHLFITFSSADAANRAITNGISICNRRCHVEKTKREPTRCLKCQGWNHIAKECTAEHDKCGNCAGEHRTSNCYTTEQRCTSCNSSDHASWSRHCPTFLKKLDEYNARNPDNLLQFFPTDEPWTWSTAIKPAVPQHQHQPNTDQSETRPLRTQRRQTDNYTPAHRSHFTLGDQIGWLARGNNAGPSSTNLPTNPNQQNDQGNEHADTLIRNINPPTNTQ